MSSSEPSGVPIKKKKTRAPVEIVYAEILFLVTTREKMRLTEIVDMLHLNPTVVRNRVSQLVKKGYLERDGDYYKPTRKAYDVLPDVLKLETTIKELYYTYQYLRRKLSDLYGDTEELRLIYGL